MPELPEVECLARAVRRVAEGGRIESATFLRRDLRDPIPIDAFRAVIEGQTLEAIERRSKYLLLRTKRGYGVIHLGMTGNLVCRDGAKPELPHTHAIFRVRQQDGGRIHLHFVDPRRFGRITAVKGHDLAKHEFFRDLGPEPLATRDLGKHLYEASRGRKKPIKNFLMDPTVVVGVGNIYAAESLFDARIHPEREAGSVSRESYDALGRAIKDVLRRAIKAGGTTFRDFRNVDGEAGYFKVSLSVYDREGEPCRVCKTPIRQLRQSGRSTWFCPRCQH